MINILFVVSIALAALVLFFYWYATYSTKSGFATDENKNNIPDSWEKYPFIFKYKHFIILILGILIGYLFSYSSFLAH